LINGNNSIFSSSLNTSEGIQKEDDLAIIAITSTAEENTAQIIISTGPAVFPAEEEPIENSDSVHVEILSEDMVKVEMAEDESSNDITQVIDLEPKSDDEEEDEANEGKHMIKFT
jgi:hypothetical protein